MKLNITKKIGNTNYVFQVEGANLFEVITEAQKLSFGNVIKCGVCGSDRLEIRAYSGEFEYVKVVCMACRGQLTFGKKKNEKDVYFLRRREDHSLDWQEYKSDKPTDAVVNKVVEKFAKPDTSELGDEPETEMVPF